MAAVDRSLMWVSVGLLALVVAGTALVHPEALLWSAGILAVFGLIAAVVCLVWFAMWVAAMAGVRSSRIQAAIVVAVVAMFVIILTWSGSGPGVFPAARPETTVPVSSVATLGDDSWTVHEELTLDESARKVLAGRRAEHLAQRPPTLGGGWRLDGVVDGDPVYRRTREFTVTSHRFRAGSSRIPAPEAYAEKSAYLVARDGSTLTLMAPRNAVYGTSPPSGAAVATADLKVWQTEVPLPVSANAVRVGLVGTWMRSKLGAKAYDYATWPLWPLVLSLAVTWIVPALRRPVWGWLVRRVKRLTGRRAGAFAQPAQAQETASSEEPQPPGQPQPQRPPVGPVGGTGS